MSDQLRVLVSAKEIQQRVQELGKQIDADYPEGPIYLVAILKGSFVFLADLSRAIKRHSVRIEFMAYRVTGRTKRVQVRSG